MHFTSRRRSLKSKVALDICDWRHMLGLEAIGKIVIFYDN